MAEGNRTAEGNGRRDGNLESELVFTMFQDPVSKQDPNNATHYGFDMSKGLKTAVARDGVPVPDTDTLVSHRRLMGIIVRLRGEYNASLRVVDNVPKAY